MPGYTLNLAQEENIVLGAGIVRRLIEYGDGNAALLYLCLARHGSSEPEKLRAELKWDEAQFSAAERALCSMGLISTPAAPARKEPEKPAAAPQAAAAVKDTAAPAPAVPVAPETAIPEYSREDVMQKLENDDSFASLLQEVERKLGRLSDPSVRKLLGLYDYLGLPAEVIFLLVNYCAERKERQFGAGKPPTMREVEKEGYAWTRRELFSVEAADAYIRSEREKRSRFSAYMAALQLGSRAPSPGEERYLGAWSEMGFPAETVALAYDKTILKCHELKWPYCNGILKRWHEKNLHSPEEAMSENAAPRANSAVRKDEGRNAWMKDYD